MIVDVRVETDDPRVSEFHQRRLKDLAADAGIGYRWMGASLRGNSEADMVDGIEDLIALSSVSATVLLGREPDPNRCRRSTAIAPVLQARGMNVVHILPDGSTRRHEPPLPFDQ